MALRLIRYDLSEFEEMRRCLGHEDDCIRKHAQQKWESWWLITTKDGDITMSTPHYESSPGVKPPTDGPFGFYFQPRQGTGRGVIKLEEVAEAYRIYDDAKESAVPDIEGAEARGFYC